MDVLLTSYATQGLHGLVSGMLLFLVASGLTLVFGMMGILNLAHAAFYMLGAYFAYSVTQATGSFWLSFIFAPLIVGIVGIIIERFILRKAHSFGHVHELLLTLGLFFMMVEIVRLVWGKNPLTVAVPTLLSGNIPFMGQTYPVYRLFILFVSTVILLGMAWVMKKTRIGITIRASVSDGGMVDALGTNVPVVFLGVFGTGAALAALAGVIAAPFLSTDPGMGGVILMDSFVVIVIGGFGSLLGAFVASLMVGELQSFGVLWIPRFALVLQFLLMAAVLIIKPAGLFGEKE